jgi:hypothetical protein
MIREEVFQATKKVFGLYGAFFDVVAQEMGIEKALSLHVRAHETLGIKAGKALCEVVGTAGCDIHKLGAILRESNLSIGIESELKHADATSAVFHNLQCPLYEGYRMGGLDEHTAEVLCQLGAPAKLGSTLRQLNPNLTHRITRYRTRLDEPCEEEITLG